jgi:DNA-binding response OmpR family regulator
MTEESETGMRAPATTATVLVVEDEEALLLTMAHHLRREGYEVLTAARGDDGLRMAREHEPDLIVLDLMLPGVDGMGICRALRRDMQVPIIMVTALGGESDRVAGLDTGADDYLPKPFGMRELLARVRALLRRAPMRREAPPAEDVFRSGDLEVDSGRREVRREGELLRLKPREYELLLFLLRNPGQVLSREHILESVWEHDFHGDARTVDVHMRWLRQKIEPDAANPERIRTVRGSGYLFEG